MNDSQDLKTMLDNQQTELNMNTKPKNMMEAYLLAYRIQEGDKFFQYFNKSNAKTPTPLVVDYMRSLQAPAMATVAAANVKDVLFEGLHQNSHKTALLKGVTQAYLNVCLFIGLAGICTQKDNLNYEEAIMMVKSSLDSLESGYENMCNLASSMCWSGELKEFEEISMGAICFSTLKKKFDDSVQVVNLYVNKRIKYNQSYDSLVQSIEKLLKEKEESEDRLFFHNVLSVLSNADQFTGTQITYVKNLYANKFSKEQRAKHSELTSEMKKEDIRAKAPKVSESKSFFFKDDSTESGIINLF